MPSRRSFLGGLAGAAVAGPGTIAKAASTSIGSTAMLSSGIGQAIGNRAHNESYGAMAYAVSKEDLLTNLIKLQAMTKEQVKTDYDGYRDDLHEFDIHSLRSVSDRHKRAMINERRILEQHRRNINGYLKKLMKFDL